MEALFVSKTKDTVPEELLERTLIFFIQEVQSLIQDKSSNFDLLRTPFQDFELVLVFVDDEEMQSLNSQFREKDYVTDVLSFAPIEKNCLGELVFCLSQIQRQSLEHQMSFENELVYMLFHGLLHLLGYDHEASPEDKNIMFEIQDKIFENYLMR